MTAKEFSDRFDVLWNNIASNEAPGINEYEKSVFLTKAQDEILKNYFSTKNSYQQGFDDSAKRQVDFSNVMKVVSETVLNNFTGIQFDPRSLMFSMPSDLFLFVNEQVTYTKEENNEVITKDIRQVIPIHHDDYRKLMSKPFKEPLKYQCWRLINSSNGSIKYAEVIITSTDKSICDNNHYIVNYIIRYVKKPRPILLADFANTYGANLSINGYVGHTDSDSDYAVNANTEPCELDSILHEEILQRAVELAKAAYSGANEMQAAMTVGQRSE